MSRLEYSNQISPKNKSSRPNVFVGTVIDVITNEESKGVYDVGFGDGETRNLNEIGWAKIRKLNDLTSAVNELSYFPPYDYTLIDLPIVGEIVEIVDVEGTQYYRRITTANLNTGNAKVDTEGNLVPVKEKSGKNKSTDYRTTAQTGTPNSSTTQDKEIKNEYFEPSPVNHLRLYEGDKVLQTRFGQSLRFSGFNNPDNLFAPTIILRNRQGAKSFDELELSQPTEENFVDDGSTIALTSGEYEIGFTAGTVDTPLETTPVYLEEPELKGTDQILINSGRIIISSKDSEMLFYSKGNYGFVSDGKLTIDNGLDGAEMDFNGDVRMTTNSNNVYILGDSGEIYLNTEEQTEPLVRGNTLVEILKELLTELAKETHPTPAGPSGPPVNAAAYNAIANKLDTILSTLNYTE